MTVRVALQTFGIALQREGLGSDGREMCKIYLQRISELNKLIALTTR